MNFCLLTDPMTKILSEPSLHVEQDSSINLTCIASAIEQPGGKGSTSYSAETGVLWYKNDKVIHILIYITWQIICLWAQHMVLSDFYIFGSI